jgi:predicted nucleotide-binding protein (sugar kinase/HSP70/actin superfamily)
VAKNHAVGYAFAQATGKEIIIPPNPELVGAFGIALIAQKKYEQHDITALDEKTTLQSLISEELKHLGSFTCRSCENYCTIERYEVGGRQFPFGGSCTKYEHQWKQSKKILEKENLVDLRNKLVLEPPTIKTSKNGKKGEIGIPRALLTHSLYPLFATFLQKLGFEVVLSEIDQEKELMTNAAFCYPIQILHGAVMDLRKKGITEVFLPHIHTMPKGETWLDATLCPITQASPYYISAAFNDLTFHSPVLDFLKGYQNDNSLIKYAVKHFNTSKKKAEEAYAQAVEVQESIEKEFITKGKEAIKQIAEKNEIGIVLVGRSYNAFPPETSLNIPKKLVSMGISVIPFDFIEKTGDADIPWFFANYVKAAIDLTQEHENLFLVYINSFSCTTDAFVQNFVRTELDTKPYLLLELDAHTADAGIQTRLEAFLEIIKNFQAADIATGKEPFEVAKVKKRGGKLVVYTSAGKKLAIRDPRVKLYFPSFSKYHTDIFERTFSLFGFNIGQTTDIKLEYPVKGLRYCSGKECIPLPVVLGHILHLVENRQPGEVIGYYMIRGGSPCAVYSYFHYIEQFLKKNEIKDVFIYRFDYLTDYLGINKLQVLKYGPTAIIIGDIINEIDSALEVVGKPGSKILLQKYWTEFLDSIQQERQFKKNVKQLIDQIATIPRKTNPDNLPKVLVSGDFFVRFSPFFMRELKELYARHNIVVKSNDLLELVIYSMNFMGGYLVTRDWKLDPEKRTTVLKALLTPWKTASRIYLLIKLALRVIHRRERKLRKQFERTGLLFAEANDLQAIFNHAEPKINKLIFGEAIPTIGKGMETLDDSIYDSLVLTGPINCLPYKISQAILKPTYLENKMPFLVFDVDTSAITPNMKRLIHANIEQIKRRREE